MDQQLIRFVEPLLRNALTQCITVFGLKNWELYTDNDFNGTDFALLGAADMKLFAKLSCQGSICILCKWIEQLMLTSLNKTKIQIWKPYSSRSVSLFFCPPTHLLFTRTHHTKAHGSISSHKKLFLTLSSLCIISLTHCHAEKLQMFMSHQSFSPLTLASPCRVTSDLPPVTSCHWVWKMGLGRIKKMNEICIYCF